jgi:hypothetical protein
MDACAMAVYAWVGVGSVCYWYEDEGAGWKRDG